MEITFIISLLLGWYFAQSLRSKDTESKSSYIDLGNNCWITPQGFVDLTPRLTLEPEWHNRNNEFERKMRDEKYESDLAWAEIEKQNAQYQLMKKDIDAMKPEDKLEYIPKWVDYMCDWHLKEKNEHERQWGYMPFEHFIASEIIPFKSYGMKMVFKPMLAQIEYVV